MNIAIVVWELAIRGGTQRQALELALSLQKKGHTVDVYCNEYDRDRTYTEMCDLLHIHALTEGRAKTASQDRVLRPTLVRKIVSRCKMYAYLCKSIIFPDPAIVHLKTLMEKQHPLSYYDVINVHDYEAYKLARVAQHPNIVWMMNDIQRLKDGHNRFRKPFFTLLQKILIRKETRNIRAITVLDERNRSLTKSRYGRYASVVRSGIDLDMFEKKSTERKFPKDHYDIFASSIFFPHRRFEDLVDAVEILVARGFANISVTINGLNDRAYAYYSFIKDRILEKGLSDYIAIVNGMSESELIKKYTEADIFVFPNTDQTWGLAVFESMLAGCVAIVSRGSGAHEVLTDKENSLLVDPKSPQEIAEAIRYFLDNPKDMERISHNAITFVKEHLSWDKYADQMLAVFSRKEPAM